MARKQQSDPKLDMTPMIDVVFELIIFFVVTIKQEDIFSQLTVNRPAAPRQGQQSEDITVTIEIARRHDGNANGVLIYNKNEVTRAELSAKLSDIARTSKKTPIIVKCAGNSPHKALVDVIDICNKHQLYSVSVFSL
jgi:biopolymer transport protein ExbD